MPNKERLLNLLEEYGVAERHLNERFLNDLYDEIEECFAPVFEKAERWERLMTLFDTSCDKCFLGHVCGTHRRSEAVCEDIKEALAADDLNRQGLLDTCGHCDRLTRMIDKETP